MKSALIFCFFTIFAFTLSTPSALACTAFQIKSNDGAQIYFRSMEFGYPFNSKVLIVPRGTDYTGIAPGGKPGKKWAVKYGYVGLGGEADDFVARCHYLHNPQPADYDAAIGWARDSKPALVVLDGLAESLAAEGRDENAVGDILTFFRHRLRPFAELGAAVVIADHVVKSGEGRGRWARGSGAKLGRYDGVSFEAVLVESYTPDRAGFVRLKVSKDRVGGVGAVGQTVWEVHFSPEKEKTCVEFRLPPAPGEFRPTAIMEKIKTHLTLYMMASKRELRSLGKHDAVDLAIEILLAEGVIESRKVGQKLEFRMAAEKSES
jgi:hypothetical protein